MTDSAQHGGLGRGAGHARRNGVAHRCRFDRINHARHHRSVFSHRAENSLGLVVVQLGVVAGQVHLRVVGSDVVALELRQHVVLHLPMKLGGQVGRVQSEGPALGVVAQAAGDVADALVQPVCVFVGQCLPAWPVQCVHTLQRPIARVLVVGQVLRGDAGLVDGIVHPGLVDLVLHRQRNARGGVTRALQRGASVLQLRARDLPRALPRRAGERYVGGGAERGLKVVVLRNARHQRSPRP